MAAQNGTLFITGKLNLFRGEKQSTKATKPIAVVGLVTVIESSRRIECEDDDEHEDESRTALFKQPPRLAPYPKTPAPPLEALWWLWYGFEMALVWLWCGFGVALVWLWVALCGFSGGPRGPGVQDTFANVGV
jgi:hypothetical protein